MPVHDWSRVDANLFHDFHQTWTINLRNALNGGLLPAGYFALVEQRAAGVVPDVLTLERHRRLNRPPVPNPGGAVLTVPLPTVWQRLEAAAENLAVRANRVAIHHSLGEVVCVLEIVSPGNKNSHAALRQFVSKTVELLSGGVHVLVVDLFPPSPRAPQGIHKAIWDEIEEQPFALPRDKPLLLAAYVAGAVKTAYLHPLGVGDVLPDMPAWLDADRYVPVPLESTYRATWESCPLDVRDAVLHGMPPPTPDDVP